LKNDLLTNIGLRQKDSLKLNLCDWALPALITAIGAIASTWKAGILTYEWQFSLPYNPDLACVAAPANYKIDLPLTICFVYVYFFVFKILTNFFHANVQAAFSPNGI